MAEAVARARETLGEVADAVPEGTALVDTAGFSEGGVKLGLGSSAAAAVAAAGAVLEYAGVSAGRQQGAAVQRGRRRPSRRPGRRRLGRRHRGGGVRRLRALRAHERRRAHHQPGVAAAAPAPGAVLDAGRGAHRRLHRRRERLPQAQHPGATTSTCRRCAPGPTTSPRPSPPATRAGSSARPTPTARRWRRWGRTPACPSSPPPCGRRRRWPAAWAGRPNLRAPAAATWASRFSPKKPRRTSSAARCSDKVLVLDIGLGATGAYRRLPSGIETFKKD